MVSSGDWIAPLVLRCLSFYQQGSHNASLELEDDGSNLRFADPTSRTAVIDVSQVYFRIGLMILISFFTSTFLRPL